MHGSPGSELVLETVRAGFQRDPFQARTIGLSVFCEGPTRIGELEYNLQRLAMFTALDEARLQQPIISSPLMAARWRWCGFRRRLFHESASRARAAGAEGIQGTINKVCHDGDLGFPVIVHTHASEVYFDSGRRGRTSTGPGRSCRQRNTRRGLRGRPVARRCRQSGAALAWQGR